MNATSVLVQSVCKKYNNQNVLSDIQLNIFTGTIYGLLGPSGAGKSTLVRMIAGIEIASEGMIQVFKNKMPDLTMASQIGYMAQSDALYSELTAKQNLLFFGKLYGLSGDNLNERIYEVLKLVDLVENQNKKVSNFSGGMKRRLSLAVALLHQPKLLILDEPTVGIDPVLRRKIWNQLYELKQQGTTILVTTHVMDEVNNCDQIGMIRNGQLIAQGSPQELMLSVNAASIEEVFLAYGGDVE